jgi:putative hydrolase of the HAD superfamily
MIKNIVFDVGNVLVHWNPLGITRQVFVERADCEQLMKQIFKSQIWYDLNLGFISEAGAIKRYQSDLGIEQEQLQQLMWKVKESLTPIHGSFELLEKLYRASVPLYALTDNTHEIMAYLKQKYDFWRMFQGVVVSADVGYLKPSKLIYEHLINTYQLIPSETLFIDDLPLNVAGAKAVNMQAIVFENVEKCEYDLQELRIL